MIRIKHSELSDEEIVERYLATQKDEYFDLLYKKYSGKVYAKCISLLKDEVNARDAVQEIFIKLVLTLSKFKGRSKLSTWIYAVSYNYCIDQVRKQKKNKITYEEKIENFDVEDEVEDSVLLDTNVKRLKIVLGKLNITDKSILLMKYQDSMSIIEISENFNKSESAIKMQIKRAKEKFRRKYSDLYQD